MTTANHSDNPLPPPDIWTGPPSLDLATIIGKTGDLGIRAIAAMANVSKDEVRRALVCGGGPSESLRKSRDLADAKLRAVLRELGWEPEAESTVTPVAGAYKLATDLLAKHWVRRADAELSNATVAIAPPYGWTLKPSWTGGCDALDGPGESRIRIEPWGFAVTDADGDEAAAGVAAMRCAMAIHEQRYGGASDPSTVTVQVLTSADIERLVLLFYWLTTKMPWHDLLGAIIDSAGVDMTSPGAEALARELVAELLRKNNGDDHGCG